MLIASMEFDEEERAERSVRFAVWGFFSPHFLLSLQRGVVWWSFKEALGESARFSSPAGAQDGATNGAAAAPATAVGLP